MSLNNQGRIHLERSGPWIGVAGLFVVLWISVASSRFAGWGVVLYLIALVPGAVLVSRWARPHPKRAAWVPLGSLAVWLIITLIGLSFWGWKANADDSTSATRVLAAQCATKFENLRQTMGENVPPQAGGAPNPGQPGMRLTKDWDALNARATQLSERAKATDCPKTLGNLTDKLRRAFESLRVHAPKANRELAAQLDAVDATDPLDKAASKKSLAGLKSEAESDDEYRLCQQALKVIGNYELDEA